MKPGDAKIKKMKPGGKIAGILARVLLVSGILGIASTIINSFAGNFNSGLLLLLGISLLLLLYGLFFEKLVRIKWLTFVFFCLCLYFLIMAVFIAGSGRNDNADYREDAVIVLGAGIRGEEVGRLLSYRLDKAAEYSVLNPGALIVVAGGQGPQEDIPEALAMERYLIDKGVPKERIIREDESVSTHENLTFSKYILDGLIEKPYSVVVITNDFHIYRAMKIAERTGLDARHIYAKITWYSTPVIYLRESVAIMKYWVLGE